MRADVNNERGGRRRCRCGAPRDPPVQAEIGMRLRSTDGGGGREGEQTRHTTRKRCQRPTCPTCTTCGRRGARALGAMRRADVRAHSPYKNPLSLHSLVVRAHLVVRHGARRARGTPTVRLLGQPTAPLLYSKSAESDDVVSLVRLSPTRTPYTVHLEDERRMRSEKGRRVEGRPHPLRAEDVWN